MSSDNVPLTKKARQRLIKQQRQEERQNAERNRLVTVANQLYGPKLLRVAECKIASCHGIIPAAVEYVSLHAELVAAGVLDP